MKRILYVILAMIILSGCRSSKVLKSSTEVSVGRSSDSTAVSFVQIDSASWCAANDSSMTSSTHYEVLRDSVGQPVLDSIGTPVTYVVQRDTVWRVVTIAKGANSTIVERDTVQTVRTDTLLIAKNEIRKNKSHLGLNWLELLAFIAFVAMIVIMYKCVKRRDSGS